MHAPTYFENPLFASPRLFPAGIPPDPVQNKGMVIGVPKEIKTQEARVALLPSAAYQLIQRGHKVLVEKNAGIGSGYPDQEYEQAGAKIVPDHADAFSAELVVKVKEPLTSEFSLLRKNQILFTYLHLAADLKLTETLLNSGVTGVAYEMVSQGRRLPLLEPMSEIAGRMSVIVGAYFLAKNRGGSGVLLGGVPGVLPGRVVVIGGGTSGINAARMATGLGADVTILEVDLERMRFLDITMHTAHTLFSNQAHLDELLPHVDLGRQSPQARQPRHAPPHAPRQRFRGYRHRPGRLLGNLPPHHPR